MAGATLHQRDMSAIEVFADVSCPFTHVGLRRLVDLRTQLGQPDAHLIVRAWPLEIVNGQPLDADFIAEEVDDIREQVAPDLFTGFTRSAFPASTLPALALAAAAYHRDLATGEQVSLTLRDLLFEQGVDIADLDVLHGLAADHELEFDPTDTRTVLADHAEGVERGVIGSPHFFTPAGGFFCPALDVHRGADGHLRITADLAGFEEFATSCFA
jgi:predicted DsbA family dithiol-disulfide isomerase